MLVKMEVRMVALHKGYLYPAESLLTLAYSAHAIASKNDASVTSSSADAFISNNTVYTWLLISG